MLRFLRSGREQPVEQQTSGLRKVPVLASIISILYGFVSIIGLLALFHVGGHTFGLQIVLQEPVTARIVYGAAQICMLVGAVLLWKMKPQAAGYFLADFVLTLLWYGLLYKSSPHHLLWDVGNFALQAAIVGYVWRVTDRWQASRVIA